MPTHDPIRRGLTEKRGALAAAASERQRKLTALQRAQDEREAARRTYRAGHETARRADAQVAQAREELNAARAAELEVRADLRERLLTLGDPTEAIAALEPEYPLLLFPVRLETRFVRFDTPVPVDGQLPCVGELRVRIYPDGLLCDSHEPLLSEEEIALGQAYWRAAWQAADELDAWTALVAKAGAPRAAWIVARCTPANHAAFPQRPGAPGGPLFANQETRPRGWQRTPVARLLPDRWIVDADTVRAVAEEEGNRYRVVSRPVIEPLAVTLALGRDDEGLGGDPRVSLADNLKVDPEIEWTFDFARAEQVGMAVRIPLVERDFTDGLVRVVAFGVKTSLAPDEATGEVQRLLDSHRYTRGLAFVPQGTPTNNTGSAASGYPPTDPRGTESFRVERGAPLTASGGDGALFMRALGLPQSAADHLAGADGAEQRRARAMAVALWPATMGYYLRQLLASEVDVPDHPADLDEATIEALRQHFITYVRGRGPFPAFRVGDIPYGLLPVAELPSQEPGSPFDSLSLEGHMRMILRSLSGYLVDAADLYAPHIGRTADALGDLMDTFRMHPSCREVYVRPAVGEETIDNLGGFMGGDVERIHEPIDITLPIDFGRPPPNEPPPGPPPPVDGAPAGPAVADLTLRSLLGLTSDFPDVITTPSQGGLDQPLPDGLTGGPDA